MLELLFMAIMGGAVAIDNIKDENRRKKYKNEALSKGEHDYIDHRGRRYWDDDRVFRTYDTNTHHDVLTSFQTGKVYVDYTKQKEDKKEREFQEAVRKGKEKARKKGRPFYYISCCQGDKRTGDIGAHFEMSTDRWYILGYKDGKYYKWYYNYINLKENIPNSTPCMHWSFDFQHPIKLTEEEFIKAGGHYWSMLTSFRDHYPKDFDKYVKMMKKQGRYDEIIDDVREDLREAGLIN